MNDLQTRQVTRSQGSRPQYEAEALSAEIAKMLTLVAPSSMTVDQQTLWLASAVDSLADIRAAEVKDISFEVRRSVTRHNQIVPEIAKLVAERRSRESRIQQASAPLIEGPPPKRHIADRDRKDFKAADWAELNEHLEKMGAKARYHSDGTRYFPDAT
jgi:hypothetical protein